jgi:hypothetical protein
MISDKLKDIISTLETQGKMSYLEAVSEEQITKFEKEKDFKFPVEYKEWLQYSDGGECFLPAGIQLYGIAHKPFIDVNDNNRPDDKYLVIGALASGDPILCEKDGEQISIYNQEANKIEVDEIYEDFYAFLNDLYDLLGIGE